MNEVLITFIKAKSFDMEFKGFTTCKTCSLRMITKRERSFVTEALLILPLTRRTDEALQKRRNLLWLQMS